MLTQHLVLLYIIGFDLVIGFLLLRYCWLRRRADRNEGIPISWIAIIGLVNLSATFCDAAVVKAVTTIGGLALVVLILPAIEALAKSRENA